jgi:hypothetical protein
MLFTVAIIVFRIPAEWLPALIVAQFDTPENLVAAMASWIALETAALGFAVRAYVMQRDKYDAFSKEMLEKSLAAIQENRTAIADNTKIIATLVGKQERNRARNPRSSKTP